MLLLNLVFWSWFWVDLWRNSEPYTNRPARFEESLPVYVLGARGLPSAMEQKLASMQAMVALQRPSFFVVSQIARAAGMPWDHIRGWLSVGALVLVGTTVVSFLQWGLVGLVIGMVLSRLKGPSPSANGAKS
jgi:hypothetical protein